MKQLEKNIGYHFRDKSLLKTAVTHSSFANENRGGLAYNERLEFLGDAVLQLVTSEKLFKENPDMPEGRMSKQRAALVCEDALAGYSKEIQLGDFMLLGKGEEATGRVSGFIPGFTEALLLMDKGAKFEVYIPANLGYGALVQGGIPSNSTLIFEIELTDIR